MTWDLRRRLLSQHSWELRQYEIMKKLCSLESINQKGFKSMVNSEFYIFSLLFSKYCLGVLTQTLGPYNLCFYFSTTSYFRSLSLPLLLQLQVQKPSLCMGDEKQDVIRCLIQGFVSVHGYGGKTGGVERTSLTTAIFFQRSHLISSCKPLLLQHTPHDGRHDPFLLLPIFAHPRLHRWIFSQPALQLSVSWQVAFLEASETPAKGHCHAWRLFDVEVVLYTVCQDICGCFHRV